MKSWEHYHMESAQMYESNYFQATCRYWCLDVRNRLRKTM